jgi:cardiolipin-specific phospholipase
MGTLRVKQPIKTNTANSLLNYCMRLVKLCMSLPLSFLRRSSLVKSMWWNTESTSKFDLLKAAETRLLTYVNQFLLNEKDQVTVQMHDALIPKASVPHIHQEKLSRKESEDEHYTIHGVEITSQTTATASSQHNQQESPLVLLHGYMNGSAYFYRNFGLATHFHKIYSLDLLGWGLSSRPSFAAAKTVAETEDVFCESLEAWRKSQKIEKMTLAGHSMGGYLSVAYSERYPERVDKLILLSPVGVPGNDEETLRRQKERMAGMSMSTKLLFGFVRTMFEAQFTPGSIFRTITEQRGRGMVHNYITRRVPAIQDEDERRAVSDYLYQNAVLPGSAEHTVSRLLTSSVQAKEPLVDRVPNLKVKSVSFLYGDRDWMDVKGGLRVQQMTRERESGPHVTVYQVRQAGHLLMLDNWREFNQGVILAVGGTPTDLNFVPQTLDCRHVLVEDQEEQRARNVQAERAERLVDRRPTAQRMAPV